MNRRSGDRCHNCKSGKLKTRTTLTRGSRRVRYLVCDTCRTTGKEVVSVDDLGRAIVAAAGVATRSNQDDPQAELRP